MLKWAYPPLKELQNAYKKYLEHKQASLCSHFHFQDVDTHI